MRLESKVEERAAKYPSHMPDEKKCSSVNETAEEYKRVGDFFQKAKEEYKKNGWHEIKTKTKTNQSIFHMNLSAAKQEDRTFPSRPSECDDVIKRAHVSRSRGLPHREVSNGLRCPRF